MPSWTVVGLPVFTLARYSGMGLSPGALRRAGALRSLRGEVTDLGDVKVPALSSDVGEKNVANLGTFIDGSERIMRFLASADVKGTLLALGGECSLVVGELAGLAARSTGSPGVVWFDSHGDFNTPQTTPSGYIGGMCLAFACGMGPPLRAIDKVGRRVDPRAVLHVGGRAFDGPERRAMTASGMDLLPSTGLGREFDQLDRHLRRVEDNSDWIVCHLDLDVIDSKLLPSVNYPTSGGLRPSEVAKLVGKVVASGKVVALNVAAYNASLDPDGESAACIVEMLGQALG